MPMDENNGTRSAGTEEKEVIVSKLSDLVVGVWEKAGNKFQTLSNKVEAVRVSGQADNDHYPTEAAVRTLVDTYVPEKILDTSGTSGTDGYYKLYGQVNDSNTPEITLAETKSGTTNITTLTPSSVSTTGDLAVGGDISCNGNVVATDVKNNSNLAVLIASKQNDIGIDSSSGSTDKFINQKGEWTTISEVAGASYLVPDNSSTTQMKTWLPFVGNYARGTSAGLYASQGTLTGNSANKYLKVDITKSTGPNFGNVTLYLSCPASSNFYIKLQVNFIREGLPGITILERSGSANNNITYIYAVLNSSGLISLYLYISATTGTIYWASDVAIDNSNFTKNVSSLPSTFVAIATAVVPLPGGIGLSSDATIAGYIAAKGTAGNSTTPAYINSNGIATACTTNSMTVGTAKSIAIEEIGSSAIDLDTLTASDGKVHYYYWSTTNKGNVTNKAYDSAGSLMVIPDGSGSAGTYVKQIYYRRGATSVAVRRRSDGTTSWSPWHTYAFADGEYPDMKSGTSTKSDKLYVTRINPDTAGSENLNSYTEANNGYVLEVNGANVLNCPGSDWYHVYSTRGSDASYACQLAVGMTGLGLWYRRKLTSGWESWKKFAFTDGTYRSMTVGAAGRADQTSLKNGTYGTNGYYEFFGGVNSSNLPTVVLGETKSGVTNTTTITPSGIATTGNVDINGNLNCNGNVVATDVKNNSNLAVLIASKQATLPYASGKYGINISGTADAALAAADAVPNSNLAAAILPSASVYEIIFGTSMTTALWNELNNAYVAKKRIYCIIGGFVSGSSTDTFEKRVPLDYVVYTGTTRIRFVFKNVQDVGIGGTAAVGAVVIYEVTSSGWSQSSNFPAMSIESQTAANALKWDGQSLSLNAISTTPNTISFV